MIPAADPASSFGQMSRKEMDTAENWTQKPVNVSDRTNSVFVHAGDMMTGMQKQPAHDAVTTYAKIEVNGAQRELKDAAWPANNKSALGCDDEYYGNQDEDWGELCYGLNPDGGNGHTQRLEKNAREQRRSKLLSNQFDQLGEMLHSAGRVGKRGRSCLLSEAAEYIRELQSIGASHMQACRSLQAEPSSGSQQHYDAPPVPHEKAPSDGNGGGRGVASATVPSVGSASSSHSTNQLYRFAFHDSGVPMAVASMDGCFVECNGKFVEASGYSKEELLSLTIFNLTAAHDLHDTFAKVSQMLRSSSATPSSLEVRAVVKYNQERGRLAISLVRNEHEQPTHFSVCIVYSNMM
eukprot:CAMPEP_0171622116 /NCGR_PEP_ID=MMETSP0990-20121206/17041_1 /TAXON_ID=483369 /ORGANISM="non described non described, Strain CCMP2098" /LENGTH=350 /DNA_ID=CAMNT_0012187831 /DNA_START=17 /DNA_END=1069 /DNA_ORIENTATION=-